MVGAIRNREYKLISGLQSPPYAFGYTRMIKTIITDIEGTTSSLSFVKDVLFPYARQHIAGYIQEHANDDRVKQQIDSVKNVMGKEANLNEIGQQLIAWIDQDQKITPLKALQGMIWEAGYRNGDFTGHIYEDAYLKLKTWHTQDIKLYVYSSGSVFAQKLLYGFSDFGDVTPLFSGYFDTNIGQKRDASSYHNILESVNTPGESVLFLSDIAEELDAANTAGMKTYWLIRDGDLPATPSHRIAKNFDQITLD